MIDESAKDRRLHLIQTTRAHSKSLLTETTDEAMKARVHRALEYLVEAENELAESRASVVDQLNRIDEKIALAVEQNGIVQKSLSLT